MRAEAAAFVLSVSARVSEEHVVRDGNNNKVGVVGDPSRGTRAVVEQRSGVSLSETHLSAFFVNVGAVNSVVVVGVEDSRVNFLCGGAWLNIEIVIVICHDACQSSLSRNPH